MPDNVSEEDALRQGKAHLLTRVRSMMKILEMEFDATLEEILATVVMVLINDDSEELSEMLKSTLGLVNSPIPIKSMRKDRCR